MKNTFFTIFSFFLISLFVGCDTKTYDEISDLSNNKELIKYNVHIQPIIDSNCKTCHSVGGTASFYSLTNYNEVKNNINNVIDRINRSNGDPLKMPAGGSLSTVQIELFKKWKTDGLLE